jgi:hypothetical protein
MKKKQSPYRRGIWKIDPRYRIAHSSLTESQLEAIFRLSSVDAAKKQIPPVAPGDLLRIAELVCALPPAGGASSDDIKEYLRQGSVYRGAGIATLICMLAVESAGDYPPIVRKFAAGMRARNKISDREFKALTGQGYSAFAEVYVRKVIPAWHQSRQTRSPEDADCYWGRAASKSQLTNRSTLSRAKTRAPG